MNTIKQWWSDRKRRNKRRVWECGFAWAASQLLLEQETVYSLMLKVNEAEVFDSFSPFDAGVMAAIKLLQEKGVI